MSSVQPPLEIILKFTKARNVTASSTFAWEQEEYWVEDEDGDGSSVSFPWHEPWLRQALEALEESEPGSEVLERLGRCLRDFLRPTHWTREEDRIVRALNAQPPRPIHLTIRSANADELYHLPWELLPLRSRRLVTLEDCLIRYECLPVPSHERPPSPQGRILFAYSNAGGWVPAVAHEKAIREACEKAGFRFDPQQDVLHDVSRKTLVDKLNDTSRPVTALHLLCHGTQVSSNAYGLTFSSVEASNHPDRLDSTQLRDLVFSSPNARSLRLVTLCSCQGGDAGTPAHLLGSVARMFHTQGVPAVIASRMPLSCAGSVSLTETLYEGLLAQRNLRTVLSAIRSRLRNEVKSWDWLSIQFYSRVKDKASLTPFQDPPPPTPAPSGRRLILIRHEAYSRVSVEPEDTDAPTLFAGRQPQVVPIDQTPELGLRNWRNLEAQVKRLASPDGDLLRAYAERDADVAYYGFPYVPLAALAGLLAKNRQVHTFEYVEGRFKWESGADAPYPSLEVDVQPRESGTAVRLRLSVSAPVSLEDCREVLPDSEVRLDLHFTLQGQKRGIVRREDQLKSYVQMIQETLDKHIAENPDLGLESIHIFAAVPVSVAFHLGRALATTWLPECFIYNYGKSAKEVPAYKWRLSLQEAALGRRSIKIFK